MSDSSRRGEENIAAVDDRLAAWITEQEAMGCDPDTISTALLSAGVVETARNGAEFTRAEIRDLILQSIDMRLDELFAPPRSGE